MTRKVWFLNNMSVSPNEYFETLGFLGYAQFFRLGYPIRIRVIRCRTAMVTVYIGAAWYRSLYRTLSPSSSASQISQDANFRSIQGKMTLRLVLLLLAVVEGFGTNIISQTILKMWRYFC